MIKNTPGAVKISSKGLTNNGAGPSRAKTGFQTGYKGAGPLKNFSFKVGAEFSSAF